MKVKTRGFSALNILHAVGQALIAITKHNLHCNNCQINNPPSKITESLLHNWLQKFTLTYITLVMNFVKKHKLFRRVSELFIIYFFIFNLFDHLFLL